MSGRTYLRAILLAGLITTLLNFNILNCDEEFLIGLISCLFFLIIVVLTRQFIKNQFFQEMDMLFMIFAYLLYSVKDSLIEGTSFSKWVSVQLLTHQSWLIVSKYSLEFELRYLYHSSRFALLKRIASLEELIKFIQARR